MKNPEFDNGTTDWTFWADPSVGASATGEAVTGAAGLSGANSAKSTIVSGGAEDWRVQMTQPQGIATGKSYLIRFMAKAEAPKTIRVVIQQNGGAWTEYFSQSVDGHLARQLRAVPLRQSHDRLHGQVKFYVGGNTTTTYIDKVTMTE